MLGVFITLADLKEFYLVTTIKLLLFFHFGESYGQKLNFFMKARHTVILPD